MKKLFAVMLALVLLLSPAALAEGAAADPAEADVGEVDVSGVWYMRQMTFEDGGTMLPETMGMEFTLELIEDGSVIMTDARGAYRQVDKGVWSFRDDVVTIVIDDEYTMTMRLEGDALTAEDDRTNAKWVFGREASGTPVYQPAGPVAAEQEAFAGEWTAYKVRVAGLYHDAEQFGATIDGAMLSLTGNPVFGTTPVRMEYADGALVHTGVEEEPEPEVLPQEEAPAEEAPVEEAPAEEAADGEVPAEEAPAEEAADGEAADGEAADGEAADGDAADGDAAVEEAPAEETADGEAPDESAKPDTPGVRTSRFDLSAQLLEDDTMALSIGLDGETLAVYLLHRAGQPAPDGLNED